MPTPTVNEVMQHVAKKHAKDPLFSEQPVLRSLVLALATVLVGRDDEDGMQYVVAEVLHAVLPPRAKPAPRLLRLAEEMARRMFAVEEPSSSLLDFIGRDGVEHVSERIDLDGILAELRRFAHPLREGALRGEPAE